MHSTALVPVAAQSLPAGFTWKPPHGNPGPATAGCQVYATQIIDATTGNRERLLVLDVLRVDGEDLICVDAPKPRPSHAYLSQRCIEEGRRLRPEGELRLPRSAVETVLPPIASEADQAIGYIAAVTGENPELIRNAAAWSARIEHAATYEGREFEEDEGEALVLAGLSLLLETIGPHNRRLALHLGDVDRDFYDTGLATRRLREGARLRFSFDESLDSEGDSEHHHVIELPDCIVSMKLSLGGFSDENWDGSLFVEFGGGADEVARERYVDECVLGCVNVVAERFAGMIRQLDPRQRGLAIQQISRLTRDLDVHMPVAANDADGTTASLSA